MKGEIEKPAVFPSLKGKSVFITGGGSGIGESLVEHFCQQDAKVTFVDIATKPARTLVERIAKSGQTAPTFINCDLRDIDALRSAIADCAQKQGPISVLINNAGNDDRHKSEDVSVEYWDERMQVNLRHQFFAAQAVRPQMRETGTSFLEWCIMPGP